MVDPRSIIEYGLLIIDNHMHLEYSHGLCSADPTGVSCRGLHVRRTQVLDTVNLDGNLPFLHRPEQHASIDKPLHVLPWGT